jgi:hypothetical protein
LGIYSHAHASCGIATPCSNFTQCCIKTPFIRINQFILNGIYPKKNIIRVIHRETLIGYKFLVNIDTNPFTIHINNRKEIDGIETQLSQSMNISWEVIGIL